MAPPEDEEDTESSDDGGDEEELSRRDFVIFLARDIAFAVILVAIIVGALFAYARVWPPMVVVESGSMQHARSQSFLGVIDTGDLVLLQSISSASDVVTYVDGASSGYETYSNYGDVIVFHPPGAPPGVTPIIHRAMVYVEYPSALGGGGVDIPSLERYQNWSGTNVSGNPTSSPYGLGTVTVRGVRSWQTQPMTTISLSFDLRGVTSRGFLTKGDHNAAPEPLPPVPVSAIIGKARGELPWFGLLKLTIWPTTGCCDGGWGDAVAPRNSWDSLATSLVLIPVAIFLADYGFGILEKSWKAYKSRKKASSPTEGDEGAAPDDPAMDPDEEPR